ncbi:MAG: DUF389 domain-containing protein, partial [Actinomycetota bacterium]|nr:DUF389 domain-containing protein [Actinomycetota bacterium]
VVSRTSPRLLDLFVALAAGAAGAYATVRDDVSAALPGVAVAVALVPPLAAVGVTLRAGQLELAKGATILYVANLAAIVLAGVVVLVVSGFVPIPRLSQVKRRVAVSTAVVAVATVALGVVLASGLKNTVDSATTIAAVNKEVARWLGPGTDLEVRQVDLNGSLVTVELVGSQQPPPTSTLADALVPEVGPDASVRVRWSQRTSGTAPAGVTSTVPASTPDNVAPLRPVVDAWLHTAPENGAGLEIISLKLKGDDLTVEVGGPVVPRRPVPWHRRWRRSEARHTKVTVQWTPRQEFAATSGTSTSPSDASLRARQAVDSWARAHPDVAVLRVTVAGGVATVDVAGPDPLPDLATLIAGVRAAAGTTAVVRLAPLRQVSPAAPAPP